MINGKGAESGFSLIEVLVALLVLAIGLIGLAGLQSSSIRFNHNSYLRGQAVILVNDLVDRMRANKAAVDQGITDGAGNGYNNVSGGQIANCSNATGCTSSEMAVTDVAQWQQLIAATLPPDSNGAATGSVRLCGAGDACSSPSYIVTINWGEQGFAGMEDKVFITSVQP